MSVPRPPLALALLLVRRPLLVALALLAVTSPWRARDARRPSARYQPTTVGRRPAYSGESPARLNRSSRRRMRSSSASRQLHSSALTRAQRILTSACDQLAAADGDSASDPPGSSRSTRHSSAEGIASLESASVPAICT